MKLMEVFNQAVPYKWTSKEYDFAEAEFKTPSGSQYQVTFFDDTNPDHNSHLLDSITMAFAKFDEANPNDHDPFKHEITNTGEAFVVFATVKSIIDEYMTHFKPQVFAFGASTKEPSRVKLYKRMARVLNYPNYTMKEVTTNGELMFVFTEKGA